MAWVIARSDDRCPAAPQEVVLREYVDYKGRRKYRPAVTFAIDLRMARRLLPAGLVCRDRGMDEPLDVLETWHPEKGLPMNTWTIFWSPAGYPGHWVLRRFVTTGGGEFVATDDLWVCKSLDEARDLIPPGLCCFERSPGDPASVMETWL